MYYVFVVLVLLVELHFVYLRTVLRGDRIALVLGEIPLPFPVVCACHERHRRSATVNLNIHQIIPINSSFFVITHGNYWVFAGALGKG